MGAHGQLDIQALVRRKRRLWLMLLVSALVLAWAGNEAGTLYLRDVVGAELLETYEPNFVIPRPSLLYDRKGRLLATLGAPEVVRDPLEHIPPVFEDVLVRWEDARFYAHDGVDRLRLFGAVGAVLRGDPQGGSTLTMQWAKLLKKDTARTLRRKVEDLALALALDAKLGKREVLRRYSNAAYFGHGVYGLGEACGYYFAKPDCEGLALEEAAYLVSLLRAPADLSQDDDRARKRRDAVIEQLREPLPLASGTRWDVRTRDLWLWLHRLFEHRLAGRADLTGRYFDDELDAAKKRPLVFARKRDVTYHPFVVELARLALEKRVGPALYEAGLVVQLSIDADVQSAAEKALTDGLVNLRQLQGRPVDEEDDLDGGVVVVDPRSGDLLAYVPGADFKRSQVPFAARPIQVGSSLKPFVYGELLEQGLGTLDTNIPDAPICFGGWCPKNYDGKYHGSVTIRHALSHSLNTVAVRVAERVGVDSIVARLRLLGVQGPLAANLPMALGASELTLLELGGMYATLYDGHVASPRLVVSVKDPSGRLSYPEDPSSRPIAYRPETLGMLHEAMALVLQPGGTASVVGRALEEYFQVPEGAHLGEGGGSPHMACKTGTHDGFTRVGLGCVVSDSDVGPVSVVAYVGHRIPKKLGEGLTGGRIAGPVVQSVVQALTAQKRGSNTFADFPAATPDPSLVPPPEPEEGADAGWTDGDGTASFTSTAVSTDVAADAAVTEGAEKNADAPNARVANARVPNADDSSDRATGDDETETGTGTGEEVEEDLPSSGPAVAPEGWRGLAVLGSETVEAVGPALIRSYLTHGGRSEELATMAPLLGLSIEHRVVHGPKLLGKGFTNHTPMERVVLLVSRAAKALVPKKKEDAVTYEQWDPLTEAVVEPNGDKRTEHVYKLAAAVPLLRVSRQKDSGQILSVEFVDGTGQRRGYARRGASLIALTRKRVVVRQGTLEKAWLAAGLGSPQLDGLRALFGPRVDINHIQRGFTLDLLLNEGVPVGVEAVVPLRDGRITRAGAVRVDGACLADDGEPCSKRLLPVPLAEAHVYGPRGPHERGRLVVQRDQAGTPVLATATGTVEAVGPAQSTVVLLGEDGTKLRFDGLVPSVAVGDKVQAGTPLGRLDSRGVLVARSPAKRGVMSTMAPVDGAADELFEVVRWWRTRLAWLRGSSSDLAEAQ